jgi:transcriptional regulator with XRE-family HTH domain
MNDHPSFGRWLKQRRKVLELTQADLARRVGWAAITIRKIEANQRRPSPQIARRLADYLEIPDQERAAFMRLARVEPELRLGNLPAPLTTLIGRTQEVAVLQDRLLRPDVRLLTLVGPPGIGKTRLALQAAADLGENFADGAYFIALASISDPALVASVIAQGSASRKPPAFSWLRA